MSDVRLIYFEGIPDQEIDRACSDLRDVGLVCESCRMPPTGPWNSLEWFAPTAIVLYLAQSYFQRFLGEMGKDHYDLLKKGLAKLWRRFFGKDTTVPEITVVSGRCIQKQEYNHTFSVVAQTYDGRTIKLMLSAGISEEDFALHVNAFIDFLCRHYARDKEAEVPSYLNVKGIDDQIFVTLTENKQSLAFLDPLPMDIRKEMAQPDQASGRLIATHAHRPAR